MIKYGPMPANIYYGNSYTYDSSTSTYSLTGNVIQATWSDSTYNSIVGKYTCLSNTSSSNCSGVYYVDSYIDSTTAHLVQFTSSVHYSYSGLMQYDLANDSPSYVGYMYNSVYPFKKYTSDTEKTLNSTSLSTSYYYILYFIRFIFHYQSYFNAINHHNKSSALIPHIQKGHPFRMQIFVLRKRDNMF